MTATMIQKKFAADMTVKDGERAFVAKITSDALDRDGEVLLPQGMDASEFEMNPVVFFNHEHVSLPVGKVVSLKRQADHWLAKVRFADRPKDHTGEWMPDTLLHMIQQGVVRGMSVGAQPIETRRPTGKDKELFGASIKGVISKWKLLELSIAPLPANQEALIMAVSKSMKRQDAKDLFGVDLPQPKRVTIVMPRLAKPKPKRSKPTRAMYEKAIGDAVAKQRARFYGKLYVE